MSSLSAHRRALVEELQDKLRTWETIRRPAGTLRTSTGCDQLDALFPERGIARGTLIEWLSAGVAGGAMWLALIAAREACRGHGGPLIVIDGRGTFYPPAAVLAGIEPGRLIVVRVNLARDESWALDQALRSGGAGAVLCMTDRLSQRSTRRLQLAVEAGGGVGFLVRPTAVRDEPCWAEVRLLVEPCPAGRIRDGDARRLFGRRLAVEVLKTRGTVASELAARKRLELEIDDETGVVRAAARLDATTLEPSAARRRSSGA